VSKSGTRFEVRILKKQLYRTVKQGSQTAVFHECDYCKALVFVTVNIGGEQFGALNARYLLNPHGFSAAREMPFKDQSSEQKMQRWSRNWCHPVEINLR